MWVQAVGLLLAGVLQTSWLMQLRRLSGSELEKLSKNRWHSQGDIPYASMWPPVVAILIIGALLAFLAWKLPTRQRPVRIATLVLEILVIALAVISLPSLNCNVLFGLPGIAVLVLLLREPGKSWFTSGTSPGDQPSDHSGGRPPKPS